MFFFAIGRSTVKRSLVRIVLAFSLVLSSLSIGKDAYCLVKGFVASLLERLSGRLEVIRSLLVQRHREFGSCLLAAEQVPLDQTYCGCV